MNKPAVIGQVKKTSSQIEHVEQCKLFDLVRLFEAKYPALRSVYAVPNQAAYKMMNYYRAEGLRKGAFDINVDVPKYDLVVCGDKQIKVAIWHGMRIEMKAADPKTGNEVGKYTLEQQEIRDQHVENGYLVYRCYSATEAWSRIVRYLDLPKGLGQ
jgi:hypothetical protein